MKEYFLPPKIFNELLSFAKKTELVELEKIVNKHDNGTILVDRWEVDMLLNVAKLWRLQAELKYPFWDCEHPNYDPIHEDCFMDEQEEKWGKIAMTFPV
ncbi:hypothetical protein [Pseudoalteromonas prydzensis]|uniref:hypothetical protein n=1 Tax=Pseudoalteromonas prydzensis TaxID=182141 RepID=UPI0007E525B5|nr:hypothetical protein [Pseudoalteromonas prydzensis]MBE0377571.1 hypothetical protein [Pseudoalteromonas prydzensis ACAM 620]